MIKIRYRGPNELSPGLHAAAERHGRSTTVYLLSGLTTPERRAALRRLRLSARMGYCPPLPAAQLAFALLADRIRTSIGRAGAVFRSHPAGSTVPVMVVSAGAIAFLVLSTVSIRVLHAPRTTSQTSTSGVPPAGSASATPISGPSPGQAAGGPGGPGQAGSGSRLGSAAPPGSVGSGISTSPGLAGPGTAAGTGGGGSAGGGASTGSATTLGSANPTPAAGAAATMAPAVSASTPAASTASSATPTPSPSPSASSGGLCVNLGPLGICLGA